LGLFSLNRAVETGHCPVFTATTCSFIIQL